MPPRSTHGTAAKLRGTPIPRVSAYVGHARGSMTIDTYSHVLIEATELEHAGLLPA